LNQQNFNRKKKHKSAPKHYRSTPSLCLIFAFSIGGFPFLSASLQAAALSLNEAIEFTIKNHPTILNLQSQYQSLLSNTRWTRGLYDWNINLGFRYADEDQARVVVFQPSNIKQTSWDLSLQKDFSRGSTLGLTSSLIKTDDDSTFNLLNTRYESELGIRVEQALLEGFIGKPDRVRLKTDQDRLDALRLSLGREIELLAGKTAEIYWELWREVQLLEVALQSEKEAKDFFDETRKLSRLGLREKDEIFQAEASWLQRQEERLSATTKRDNTWQRLKAEMGEKGFNSDSIPDLDDPQWENTFTQQEHLNQAFQSRSDFLSAEENKNLTEELKKSMSGKLLPTLVASGGYSLIGLDPQLSESIEQIQESKIPGWNVGMALSHSFGQNRDRSEVEQAEAAHLQSKSVYLELSRQINRDVILRIRNFKLNLELLDLAQKIETKRDFIQKSFKRKRSRYFFHVGLVSIFRKVRGADGLHLALDGSNRFLRICHIGIQFQSNN